MLEDRLTRGFIAGILSGILMNLESYTSYSLELNTLRYVDWTSIMMFGHIPPFEIGEIIWAQMSNLILAGVLGIIFVYLIPQVTSKNLLLKGWLYGVFIWITIYAFDPILLEVEGITTTPLRTSISNFVGASIFGLALAWFIKRLTNKSNSEI